MIVKVIGGVLHQFVSYITYCHNLLPTGTPLTLELQLTNSRKDASLTVFYILGPSEFITMRRTIGLLDVLHVEALEVAEHCGARLPVDGKAF